MSIIDHLEKTEVFNSYWKFGAERLFTYYRRLQDTVGPWTNDTVISEYRFTNTYRAADRVSQYLIKEVQYNLERSPAIAEVFFRSMLFKIFNKIDTWEAIEREFGPVSWQSFDLDAVSKALDRMLAAGSRIYSAAYIMPSPGLGHQRKHANHLALLSNMMDDGLPGRLSDAKSLKSAYELLLSYSGLGPFLAFQYAVDLNYSTVTNFDESDFVVAGPGAIDGIAKCFTNSRGIDPAEIIYAMVEHQRDAFLALGIDFPGLFGRPLKPIDCQNLFCEISKYSRVAHPSISGVSGRTRIKQRYSSARPQRVPAPFFPPKWNLQIVGPELPGIAHTAQDQLALL